MFSIKRIAAAAALALVAGSAAAAVTAGDEILVVFDPVAGSTYIRDLGVQTSAFTGGTFAAGTGDAWSSFYNAANGDLWAVVGTAGAGNTQYGINTAALNTTGLNVVSAANLAAFDLKLNGAISGTSALTAAGSSYVSPASAAGAATDYNILSPTTSLAVTTDGSIGQSLYLVQDLTGRTGVTTTLVGTTQFTLDSTGTFAAVATAPVPEPGTWALMAAGLMTVGAIARRRNPAA